MMPSCVACIYGLYPLKTLNIMRDFSIEFLVKDTIEIVPMRREDHIVVVICFLVHRGSLQERRHQ